MRIIFLGLAVLTLGLIISGCAKEQIIGGDKDEHGCLIAAGYRWCESTGKCQRMWEEFCKEYEEEFKIENFDDCVKAKNPIMESYPRQCQTKDGKTFVEEDQNIEQQDLEILAKSYCGQNEVDRVYICKNELVEVVKTPLGAGATYVDINKREFNCPVVGPDSMTFECKEIFESKMADDNFCTIVC
jgi:hypothetical protein